MFKDNVFNWLISNQKVFIYASFLFLFSWYLNPIIRESRIKNICAFNIVRISQKDSSERNIAYKKLANKLGFENGTNLDIFRFCQFYKSSQTKY